MSRRQYIGALLVLAASGLLGGVLSMWLLPGQAAWAQEQAAVAKELRAEKFVLVDEAGRDRATLALMDDGPVLRFYDVDGKVRTVFGLMDSELPALGLFDAGGEVRAALSVLDDGPALDLTDATGKVRANLRLLNGEPVLRLYDSAGEMRAVLGLMNGKPAQMFANAAGQIQWQAP